MKQMGIDDVLGEINQPGPAAAPAAPSAQFHLMNSELSVLIAPDKTNLLL